jgi:thymidylate kinase
LKLIEFTGIPGSGKSTIIPIVKCYLQKSGFTVFDWKEINLYSEHFLFGEKYFNKIFAALFHSYAKKISESLAKYFSLKRMYQLKYLVNNLWLFLSFTRLTLFRPIPQLHKQLIIRRFIRCGGIYEFASKFIETNSIMIFDEGFVHHVVNFFVSVEEKTIDFKKMEIYLEKTPYVHTLINVEANECVCKERLLNRKLPRRLEGRTEQEIFEYILMTKSAIYYALNHLSNKGRKIVTVNNQEEQFFEENIIMQLSSIIKSL